MRSPDGRRSRARRAHARDGGDDGVRPTALERAVERRSPLRVLRLVVVLLFVVTLLSTGLSFLTYDPAVRTASADASVSNAIDPAVVATVDGVGPGQIVAYDEVGRVVYRNESLSLYHDVDPSPVGRNTVTYVASDVAPARACAGDSCLRNVIQRTNLTTGDVDRLHSWVHRRNGSTQIHDVDRVNDSVFLVADISYPDRVFMVNTTTDETVWEWRVSQAFSPESGGSYPSDWTHLNDVEYLPDGRVMVSLRNQDQVVFIEPGEGIQEHWTLGADDRHATLFEAHNPDYIPKERGGPAVVVADSENNRLVEYQRRNGSWVRSWTWQDTRLQWPRDADRLPSGRTLVADSHGQRILSVAPDGSIAWSRQTPTGVYDVELLDTGDESAGGESAVRLGLRSRRPGSTVSDGDTSMRGSVVGPSLPGNEAARSADGAAAGPLAAVGAVVSLAGYWLVSLVPPLVLHGLLFALPAWVAPVNVALALVTLAVGVVWVIAEAGTRAYPRVRGIER